MRAVDTGWMNTRDAKEDQHAEYKRATDDLLALAAAITVNQDSIPTQFIDRMLDYRPGLLERVAENVATAEYLVLADALDLNLDKDDLPRTLLVPLTSFDTVPAVVTDADEGIKSVYWGVRAFKNGERPVDDAIISLAVEATFSPSAPVLNAAMPAIVSLLVKCRNLEFPRPTLSDEERANQADRTIERVRRRLYDWLQI